MKIKILVILAAIASVIPLTSTTAQANPLDAILKGGERIAGGLVSLVRGGADTVPICSLGAVTDCAEVTDSQCDIAAGGCCPADMEASAESCTNKSACDLDTASCSLESKACSVIESDAKSSCAEGVCSL